jgi:hypothetical protein
VPSGHPLRQLLEPQSNYLIPFDEVLLILWSFIAPPTSFDNPFKFLQLADQFANGREFFDDDPRVTIRKQGLQEAQFTEKTGWDLYPVIQNLLELWEVTENYVEIFCFGDVCYRCGRRGRYRSSGLDRRRGGPRAGKCARTAQDGKQGGIEGLADELDLSGHRARHLQVEQLSQPGVDLLRKLSTVSTERDSSVCECESGYSGTAEPSSVDGNYWRSGELLLHLRFLLPIRALYSARWRGNEPPIPLRDERSP